MRRMMKGMLLGAFAGILDVIPMIVMKLTWDANLSAFLMWVVIGFFLSVAEIKVQPFLKGLIISYSVLLPSAILIGWGEPVSLLPILFMTTILGSLLGISVHKALHDSSK